MAEQTPMMRQYLEIKSGYPDAILFFRMGDFYEMFLDDALLASRLLDISLTSRNKGSGDEIPFCGVPYHSVAPYIAKLIEIGHKVAICEQVEDPKTGQRHCPAGSCQGRYPRPSDRIGEPGAGRE